MSKKLCFLISFVLVLGLSGLAQADAIEVNNPSFEYDINGVQITEQTGWDDVGGWTLRANPTWLGDWFFPTVGENFEGFEAADGNVAAGCPPLHGDDGGILEIYQILDPNIDANATIAENRRYTLTFNALKSSVDVDPDVNALLFYSLGGVNAPAANDVILAGERTKLTSPPWAEPEYAGWEEISLNYTALSGAGSIGKRLGIKLNVPVPYYEGVYVGMDNVRVEWSWATDAWDPDPADEGEDVPRTGVTLSWKPGSFAADVNGHEVYFGTDEASVEDATTATAVIYRGSGDVAGPDANGRYSYVIPGGDLPLALGGTYYWRIDEVNEVYAGPPAAAPDANGRWKGDIWSFEVTGFATNPNPEDGAIGVSLYTNLSWTPGTESDKHDVYFGTSESEVTDANIDVNFGIYMGRQDANDFSNSNLVPALELGETYYWRIDEVNETTGTLIKGKVWDFTTAEYSIVDDMDSYGPDPAMRNVWKDFFTGTLNKNGAEVFVETDADFVRDGNSMRYAYRNTEKDKNKFVGSVAEASIADLQAGSDWTASGVEALVLYFYGDAGNGTDQTSPITMNQMYVELVDGSANSGIVKYDTEHNYDLNAVTEASWHEWNISLQDPCLAAVDMNDVVTIYIGFGGEVKTGQSDYGAGDLSGKYDSVWFDDISLYPPRCRPAIAFAYGSFDGDCLIGLLDLDVMARDWLMSGANVPPLAPEADAIAWYKFDEGSGTTTANSGDLGSTYDGELTGAPNNPTWTTDAHPNDGNALDFDGVDDYVYVADSMNLTGSQNLTFTAWVKREASIAGYDGGIIFSRSDVSDGEHGTGISMDKNANELGYTWNNWQGSWDWESGLVLPLNEWVFVALAVEPTQGIMYLAEPNAADPNIYDLSSATNVWGHDGLSSTVPNTGGWDGTSRFYLGRDDPNKADDGTFPGKISDVRIYDYTLSRGEIMYLAGVSGTIYVPLEDWRADISGDDKVNFKDYRILADNWLEEHLWP